MLSEDSGPGFLVWGPGPWSVGEQPAAQGLCAPNVRSQGRGFQGQGLRGAHSAAETAGPVMLFLAAAAAAPAAPTIRLPLKHIEGIPSKRSPGLLKPLSGSFPEPP